MSHTVESAGSEENNKECGISNFWPSVALIIVLCVIRFCFRCIDCLVEIRLQSGHLAIGLALVFVLACYCITASNSEEPDVRVAES